MESSPIQSEQPELRNASSPESTNSRPVSSAYTSSPALHTSQNLPPVPGLRSQGCTALNVESTPNGTYSPLSQGDILQDELNVKDALEPDHDTEAEFLVENNKFAFSPGELSKLYNPKSLAAFHALGGLEGIERGLKTDRKAGLSVDELHFNDAVPFEDAPIPGAPNASLKPSENEGSHRRNLQPNSPNGTPFADRKRAERSISNYTWIASNDKILILLMTAAVISLAVGLWQTFSKEQITPENERGDLSVKWVQGAALLAAIIIVAVTEGLPLTLFSAVPFATTRMLKDNNQVQGLRSGKAMGNATTICSDQIGTMGNATTICSDKTGTPTQNKMVVVAGFLGSALRFGDKKHTNIIEDTSPSAFVSTLSNGVKDLLLQSIVQNTTAFEAEEDGCPEFIGTKTETALLDFARNHLGLNSLNTERSNANIVQIVPFDSMRKCSAVVVKLDDGRYRMYVKGAPDILLRKCDRIVSEAAYDIAEVPINADGRKAIEQDVANHQTRSLRSIGLVYRDFESWPPKDSHFDQDDSARPSFEHLFNDMIFLAVFGFHDPLRKLDTPEDYRRAGRRAGVHVRMVTGDNVSTAKAIAEECNILVDTGILMEGPTLKSLSTRDMGIPVPKLRVLTRSSTEDKRILINRLKELDKVVDVTGDGTLVPGNAYADFPWSCTGPTGTEITHHNFASIMKDLSWGRIVHDAVWSFLRATRGIVAAQSSTILAAFTVPGASPTLLSFPQFLWFKFMTDTFVALSSHSTAIQFTGRFKPAMSNKSPSASRRHRILLPGISNLIAFSCFISNAAAQSTQTADESWRQRALDTLSQLIVSCAVLLAPTITLLIAGCIVLILLWLEAEGTLALFMLGMACVFVTIRPAPDQSQGDDDGYIRLAVGLSYLLFMLAYCRLVVHRNRYGRGFCTIAVILGTLSTITAMAIPAVREYWVTLTNLNPTFALSLAIPSSFFLSDLAIYIIIAVNYHTNRDELSSPSQLEASIGSGSLADMPGNRRTYRVRDIPVSRFRNLYPAADHARSTSPTDATRGSQPRQTRRLRVAS